MNKWLLTSAMLLALTSGAQAGGDAAAGKARSAPCAGCHNPDGNSVNPIWPKLAGQHPKYIEKQLHDFKANQRTDPLMNAQAAPLTDSDIENLAAYFSSQTISPGTTTKDKASSGQKLYRGGNTSTGVTACAACHGPTGMGNPLANFPRLAGQHAAYIEKQLKAFRSGTRANDAGQMMRNIAFHMTDAEIAAVAQYVQGLR